MKTATRAYLAHGKLVLKLEAAEKKMRRAFRAWDRALETVRRSEARLNKADKARFEIGGTLSPSDLEPMNRALSELASEGAARLQETRLLRGTSADALDAIASLGPAVTRGAARVRGER